MYQYYMFNIQRNAKISLFTTKSKLLIKDIKEHFINWNPRINPGLLGLTSSNLEILGLRKRSRIGTPSCETDTKQFQALKQNISQVVRSI